MRNCISLPLNFIKLVIFSFEIVLSITLFKGHEGTSALEGGEGTASRPGRFIPPGKTRYPLYRRLAGPQGRSGYVRKISPPPGFDPRSVRVFHYDNKLRTEWSVNHSHNKSKAEMQTGTIMLTGPREEEEEEEEEV
jgi:hypothetical protein